MSVLEMQTRLLSDEETEKVRDRIGSAERYRRPYELDWLLNLAYVNGNQWVVKDVQTRRLVDIRRTPLDPGYTDLYVADIIHENRGAALGELTADSDRPELALPGNGDEDEEAERIADQANRIAAFGWEMEWDADAQLALATQYAVDLGVSAIHACYDWMQGEPRKTSNGENVQAPVHRESGRPITDPGQARTYVAQMAAAGQTVSFRTIREGKTVWRPGTAFNILTPPGVPHEDRFPWDCWVEPALLDDVKAAYPAAADLTADTNIGSVLGITVAQAPGDNRSQIPKVADSVWLYRYYERPTQKFPDGRTIVLAGTQKKVLEVTPSLPSQRLSGAPRAPIVYFHWHRLTDRFYSRSLIDSLRDPQRMRNRNATQAHEIADRSMPFGMVSEKTLPEKPSGRPMEWVEIKQGANIIEPKWVAGPGPGSWMKERDDQILQDAAHASTLNVLKLGENPPGVLTYAQYSAMLATEAGKRASIRTDRQRSIAMLLEISMEDARRYWPEGKRLLVAGDQNRLQAVLFDRSMLPDGCVVRPAPGAAEPRTGAAQAMLIDSIWNAAVASGAATADPQRWMDWLYDSHDQNKPLPIPEAPADTWADTAEIENRVILQGYTPEVAYYDPAATHIPIHRRGQDEAREAGDMAAFQRFEDHIQQHLIVSAQNQGALPAPAATGPPGNGSPAAPSPAPALAPPAPATPPPAPSTPPPPTA